MISIIPIKMNPNARVSYLCISQFMFISGYLTVSGLNDSKLDNVYSKIHTKY